MKIEYDLIKQQDFEEFADEFGLTLVVHENTMGERIGSRLERYSAYFKDFQVLEIENCYGTANTIDAAIDEYAMNISDKSGYIISANKYIDIPNLTYIVNMNRKHA
jgi:hypothetical protein